MVLAALALGLLLLERFRSAETPTVPTLAAEPARKRSGNDTAMPREGADLARAAAVAVTAADSNRPFHVLLIIVDSLRADMPWMGYDRPIAPWLTAFAQRSVTYTRAHSISSTTARSVGPLLVGRYPSEMERNGLFFSRWYPSNEFVSERLSAAGHHTAALLTHSYFTR